jgi:hypothetical protein
LPGFNPDFLGDPQGGQHEFLLNLYRMPSHAIVERFNTMLDIVEVAKYVQNGVLYSIFK